jgi:carboxylate-amine ligase
MAPTTDAGACFEEPLPHPLARQLAGGDLGALSAGIERHLADADVTWGADGGPFLVDPVPRVLSAAEWEPLAAGLCQRTRALDRFVADIYGRQQIVREGLVPPSVVASAEYFEPLMQQATVHDPERRFITIAGLDCVRGPDGRFRVLEDNVRTPSGIAYSIAARAAVTEHVPAPDGLAPLEPALEALGDALRAAAPSGVEDPCVVVLTDGPANVAYYDHRALAEALDLPLVRLVDLRLRDGRLCAHIDDRDVRVDVVYRRTDEDRLSHPRGGLTDVARLLLEPWSHGRLGLVNAFGAGIADDKLLHAHVEDMVRFYLEEEPLIESVRTWDLSTPRAVNDALERLDELVVKPRAGHGGAGVVIGPLVDAAERDAARDAIRASPIEYVVQDYSPLSTAQTVIEGSLAPRHVDLRPFVFYGADAPVAMAGGLTRVAFDDGEMVVNSSKGGGVKDTWVVS